MSARGASAGRLGREQYGILKESEVRDLDFGDGKAIIAAAISRIVDFGG